MAPALQPLRVDAEDVLSLARERSTSSQHVLRLGALVGAFVSACVAAIALVHTGLVKPNHIINFFGYVTHLPSTVARVGFMHGRPVLNHQGSDNGSMDKQRIGAPIVMKGQFGATEVRLQQQEKSGGDAVTGKLNRRAVLSSAIVSSMLPFPQRAFANDQDLSLSALIDATRALPPNARAAEISLRPLYDLETPDIFYPSWFEGRWTTTSTLRSVIAPAGNDLFSPGRNGTEAYRRATLEIGEPLVYDVRWRKEASEKEPDVPSVVFDREFSVGSISRASMGSSAVDNIDEDGPNHITTYLKPKGAPAGTTYVADLNVVGRRTDPPLAERQNSFTCAETTRQKVSVVVGEKAAISAPKSPLLKEISTIVAYELDSKDPNIMRGYQRTATFLVPDSAYTGEADLVQLAAAQLTSVRGRQVAIDVRLYELAFKRLVA